MPYVEGGGPWPNPQNPPKAADWAGFGTWPFGEEWLWEAVATCYLPLLDRVLGRAPLTLSLTPVLCDQLEAPGALARCVEFLREVRPASHALDIDVARRVRDAGAVSELARSQAEYAAAAARLASIVCDGGDAALVAILAEHATWTSSATHAILPLLASDCAISLQLRTGIASHRRRAGEWGGGFWLPECAYAAELGGQLEDAGIGFTCVELTRHFGAGDPRHLRPLLTAEGPLLWPLDRILIDLAWGVDGYPSRGPYRDSHALTDHHHRVRANDGEPYDRQRGARQAAADAREFVTLARKRVAGGGMAVCAFDTELFGHWWYEGIDWLEAVVDECERQDLPLVALDESAAERHAGTSAPPDLPACSWGACNDLSTWSGPQAAEFAWRARAAELAALSTGRRPSDRALRELLALQASDWAFLHTKELAGEYPRERAEGHLAALRQALAADERYGQGAEVTGGGHQAVRNLAPVLAGWEG
jgi:1,4-alpha-glucan branching enzyme